MGAAWPCSDDHANRGCALFVLPPKSPPLVVVLLPLLRPVAADALLLVVARPKSPPVLVAAVLLAFALAPSERLLGVAAEPPKSPPVAGLLPNNPPSCVAVFVPAVDPNKPPEGAAGAAGLPNSPPDVVF